jgi:NADH-quinone oxidoreductase subunit E
MSDNSNISDYLVIKLKDNGYKLTKSRKAILNLFMENLQEKSAEELYVLSRKKNIGIGLATIYRTIRLFEKIGLITKKGFENNKVKYGLSEKIKGTLGEDNLPLVLSNTRRDAESIHGSKNKSLINNSSYSAGYSIKNVYESYDDTEKIDKMQGQLNEWLNDINKIKREKEIILEDVIEDIGKIDKIIQCHDSRKNNLIQILLDVQKEYNWLPKHALLYVGSKLNIPLTNIYGIASFYKYFNLEPRGKHSILVCMGTACHIRGSMNLIQRIVNILGVKPGDTTRDYKFTLDTVNCLGCCALGPVVMVDNKYYSNPSTREIKKIFGKFN